MKNLYKANLRRLVGNIYFIGGCVIAILVTYLFSARIFTISFMGSMNSAEIVYAQPEREGEAVDPAYQRFLPGLGLTKTMLLPHYQENKDDILDGQRVYEDIAFSDSHGRVIYAIPDGSYLFCKDGKEELRGEA